MKRFVSKEEKLIAAALAVFFALILIFEPVKALMFVLIAVFGAVFFRIEENPPRWLMRSPLGRWLRR
jgi:hypothetical protein